jgi:hypothetical protein
LPRDTTAISFISFDDGRVALYPAPLLYAALDEPGEMIERPEELL